MWQHAGSSKESKVNKFAMKQINVSVVGLSGNEKEKGQMGVGKSCLCNRFIRPMTDDYFIDHISVLSQSDFSGRIVNNDHFLYWGEVKKTTDEGTEYNFNVVEQTEFIDDATFQPFKVGKMEPYYKRCTTTKVASAEKLMYVCKSQLGIEKEYEQKVLPDGRLTIDGFVVVFDVSPVPNRSLEKQVEFVHNILMNLIKTKKPIVLVTTKNDDASEAYIREAEKVCQRKEYKGAIQLVETSAHESINIDMAFILLAQLIDKTKNRTKITTYNEAARTRKELLDTRTEAVAKLIRNQITDYHTLWSHGSKMLAQHREWNEFLDLFGQEAGQRIFRRHMKKLRDDHLNKRLQQYMDGFVGALQDIIPDIGTFNIETDEDWNSVRNYIRNHVEFDQYFFDCQRAPWTDLSDVSDIEDEARIPFDILDTPEAETVFKNHLNALQQEQKRLEWKKQFKKLLEETGYVTPGKQLAEVRVLFMGRECFEALSEHDCQQIYDNHQRELIDKAKHNFLELLLEHADLFQHFKNLEPSGTITQDDIKEITEVLQDDLRYKLLDRLDQDRKVMLFQHLGFIHCPIREHCPAFPNCMDCMIERILSSKKTSTLSSNKWKSPSTESILNLLIMGSEHLASDLLNDIRISSGSEGEYIYDNQTYYLNYRIVNGDMESFKSIDFQSSGLICVYSNQQSFETLKDNLERSLLCNLELEDKFENLPIVLVYQPHDLKENEIDYLRTEGLRLAEMLHCEFIDTMNFYRHRQTPHQKYVYEILNNLIISLRLSDIKCDDSYQPDHPDLRIIICMFCGDLYSPESVLAPLVSESTFSVTQDRSILVDTFLGESKRRIEFIISSYHGANQYRDELIHGFILFYSTKRKSSLANLNAFTMNIPNMPIQIIAITENGGANAFFNNDLCQLLITEGNSIADRYRGNFMTSSAGQPLKFAIYTPFLKKVWDRKPEIESLHMEEPVTLDSGEGTLEHSMHHLPQPPPRHESYMLKNTAGTDGSGSENYEHLPTRSLNSLNVRRVMKNVIFRKLSPSHMKRTTILVATKTCEKDISMDDTYDDDKDEKARLLHQGFQIYPPPTTPPEPAPPDHHMAPSSIMRQFKGNLVSASQSSLDEITSDVSGSKDSLTTHDSGWLDDQLFISREAEKHDVRGSVRRNTIWNNFSGSNHHAFTTGRRQNESSFANKIRPKGPSQTLKQPGKLNLKNFQLVSDAVARMNVSSDTNLAEGDNKNVLNLNNKSSIFDHAPLAAPEDDSDEMAEYAQIKNVYGDEEYSESDSDSSSSEQRKARDGYYKMNRKQQTHKRTRKKRVPIPVQPPKVPPFGTFVSPPEIPMHYQKMKTLEKVKHMHPDVQEEESSVDVSSPRDNNSPIVSDTISTTHADTVSFLKFQFGMVSKLTGDNEKLLDIKMKQKNWKEEEKLEKRRLKEEQAKLRKQQDKEKEQEKKMKRKSKQNSKASSGAIESLETALSSLPEFMQSDKNNIPIFLHKCIQFIEQEGLDSEGIYRVPGNRAHVDLLFQKFEEDSNVDIELLDIPVNAVATALKDFFSKRFPPLFDKEVMAELEEIAGTPNVKPETEIVGSRNMSSAKLSMEVKTDRSCRLISLRNLLNKLPVVNFAILKFIFQHFVRVSENSKLNSMDSKNLAICWWPTLIPIEFTDMGHFEQLRPYLEDIVQTMIDQFPYLYCGKEAFVMV
ncbi:rho GTPase-activating protein 190 isoform X8 [Episyrphus balteatus]|uniref:rho GTPase-activating protein 190 isoform X8 n=1 Tax=Episyrphus balteatus TaxID=286459 RepID=UPI002485523A|nr:rho GTPase-activating protein 190 isoform X8 [Episyrphus balteatus]